MRTKELKRIFITLFTCLFLLEQILGPAVAIATVSDDYEMIGDYDDVASLLPDGDNAELPENDVTSSDPEQEESDEENDNPTDDESSVDGNEVEEMLPSGEGQDILLPDMPPEILIPGAMTNALPTAKVTHGNHNGIVFDTPLVASDATSAGTSIKTSGNYYLDSDLYLPVGGIVFDGNITVNLCLNGHSITAIHPLTGAVSPSFAATGLIILKNGAAVNIYDCYSGDTHGGDCVHTIGDGRDPRELVDVYGGLIGGVTKSGIHVNKGELHMYGGTIAGCRPSSNGAIYLQHGTVTLESGVSVCYNRSTGTTSTGGGISVYKRPDNILTINGAAVEENMAVQAGGGVYLGSRAQLVVNGGSISGNKIITNQSGQTCSGAGIYASALSEMTLNDARICDNVASTGTGGIYVSTGCTLDVSGETIIDGNIVSDGSISFDDNMTAPVSHFKGNPVNVGLYCNAKNTSTNPVITVIGALTSSAKIGITSKSDNGTLSTAHSLVVAKAADSYNDGALPNADFGKLYSDDKERSLLWLDNQAEISTGRVHYICGAECTHLVNGEPIHSQTIYNPSSIGYAGGSPESGSYYIESNMELNQPIVIRNGKVVNICFNGHEIRNMTGSVFIVEKGGVLNLCDCYGDRSHDVVADEFVHSYRNPCSKVERTVEGGLAVGHFWLARQSGGVIVDGGEFNLFSGLIAGACKQSGVEVVNGGNFTMWGGSVNDNYKVGNGAGIYVDNRSTFDLRGGEIRFNRATEDGGGIYSEKGFTLSGNLNVSGNVTNIFENNIFIPAGVLLDVTDAVTGQIGVKMERVQGVFTTGGKAAAYVDSFKADATGGTYVDVQGKELCLTGYGIRYQPTSESRTVVMRSPENVISYQWYEVKETPLTGADVISSLCTYNTVSGLWEYIFPPLEEGEVMSDSLECLTVALNKGDTLRLKPQTDISSVALLKVVTTSDGDFTETVAYSETPAKDGSFYVAAPERGKYILAAVQPEDADGNGIWQVGSRFAAEISLFRCGKAVVHQTGPGYTGADGTMVICEVHYVGDEVVVYSEPFVAGSHEHILCGGANCNHNPEHTDLISFTPIASNLDGELLVGANAVKDLTLRSGYYAVVCDMKLPKSITINGNVTICLRGHQIVAEKDYAVKLAPGATFSLCDCTDTYGGLQSEAGGGLYLPDNATATIYAADIRGSRSDDQAGGIYVSPKAKLELSSRVKVTDNRVLAISSPTGEEMDCNVYLAGGAKIILFEGVSDYMEIGVTAEDISDVFTDGAGGLSALNCFFSDMPGRFIKVTGTELAFLKPFIVLQPTSSRPTVVLNNAEGAVFQWYQAEGTTVTDRTVSGRNNGRYDSESGTWQPAASGVCFTVGLDAGEILRLVPAENWTNDVKVTLTGDQLSEPLELFRVDDMYQWTAEKKGEVTVTLTYPGSASIPSLSAEIYQVTTALEGLTTATYSGEAGAYVCIVTYEDGMTLQSNLIVLTKAVSPNKGSGPIGGGWKDKTDDVVKDGGLPFTDVKEGAWYYDNIKEAYEAGLIEGVEKNLFAPRDNTTRAMAVMMLWRMAGEPEPHSKTVFVDVEPKDYYYKAVCWADENKIAVGLDKTHFAPDRYISREQIVTLLYRYATINDGMMMENWQALNFRDMPADWAMVAFEWAVADGIIEGRDDGILDPKAFATRAEVVAILNRYRLRDEDDD